MNVPKILRAVGAATILVMVMAVAACSGSATGSSGRAAAASSPVPAAAGTSGAESVQNAFVSVIRRVLPSVVEIRTSSGLGSGVVFDSAGDIVTNAHVVGDVRTFQVFVASSASPRPATLVGKFAPDDLAVIKARDATGLSPAAFGNSAKLSVGDLVLAIGAPLGLASSATEGIVSATGRTVSEPAGEGSPGATLPDTIQTSAAINPGNSGGALVSLSGQVVGIPTLAATDQQGGGAAPGIGFAISSNTVRLIAGQLARQGKVTRSGRAAMQATLSTIAGPDGSPAGIGVVSVTRDGPAARAGIVPGDVITAVNGTPTTDVQSLAAVLAALQPGEAARVAITRRDGSKATVRVTLGELPAS